MSFSQDVKEELENVVPTAMHCKVAELAGLMGELFSSEGENLKVTVENTPDVRKCFTLLNKTYNISTVAFEEGIENGRKRMLFTNENFPVKGIRNEIKFESPMCHLKKSCCRRAYLRGVFLASGSISDPSKGYYLEMVFKNSEKAEFIKRIFEDFSISFDIMTRRDRYVVYTKNAEMISDTLNLFEAHTSMMNFVNTKIIRNVRNRENRRYNCDIANLARSSDAGSRMMLDIKYIDSKVGLDTLPEQLKEMAEVRMEHIGEPLAALGQYLNPPVGKSGVNHRLRKISEYAEELRKKG